MLESVLIANRGEIACRIVRSARAMGLRCIAVYSDADAAALHVREADEAWRLGPAPAAQSYLDLERVLDVAKDSRASALHPGYGFLSENPRLARECETAGIVYVGPGADAIARMGDKAAAKQLMQAAGVPVLPGRLVDPDTPGFREAAREAAGELGLPLIVKPAAGGGGKGMYVVSAAAELERALESAARLARSAFGDARLLLERHLPAPRHLEVQVLADAHGTVLVVGDRDCSLQRRHQKLVEEAPIPWLSVEARAGMHAAALAAARAVSYRGAGTVEFLWQDGSWWFLEMNTRLQVEHPVTEMTTGLDLVAWQLRIAAGEPLPAQLPAVRGHAIEARVCAEDPARGFAPESGPLLRLQWPHPSPALRVDAGFMAGDVVPPDYDSLLGKVIAYGESREAARLALERALGELRLAGPRSNVDWLRRVLRHPDFAAGPVTTDFLARHDTQLLADPQARLQSAMALAWDCEHPLHAALDGSPWARPDGFRLGLPAMHTRWIREGDAVTSVTLERTGDDGWRVTLGGAQHELTIAPSGPLWRIRSGCRLWLVEGWRDGEQLHLWSADFHRELRLHDPRERLARTEAAETALAAPLPGVVAQVLIVPGDQVVPGQELVIVEAMKMEHAIRAPRAARVGAVHCSPGERVAAGVPLLELLAADDS